MDSYSKKKIEARVWGRWLNARRWTLPLTCAFLVSCVGCGYPKVSPKAYEISKALYSVCNLKRQDDLDKVSDVISQAVSTSELTESEAEWLMVILEQARAGDWEAAALEARSVLQDQTDL